jgi:anti-sigma regulatory factor (Ser/Thr protein kinase)
MAAQGDFHHEAFFYGDADAFLAGTVPFVRAGLEAEEAILVALPSHNLELLREALGADAAAVQLTEIEQIGRNPARIIPVWREFLAADDHPERGIRGIGEPVWADRSAAELDECHRHESLLNLAFDDEPGWPLLCPYDTASLADVVLLAAEHSHPTISGERSRSVEFDARTAPEVAFGGELEPLDGQLAETAFDLDRLAAVRRLVLAEAVRAGLGSDRAGDLVTAANEVAVNSVRHGGGIGILQVWRTVAELVCDFRDFGRISDPLVGRRRPPAEQPEGRGLWLANQLCDLVQIRSDHETVVRLRMSLP